MSSSLVARNISKYYGKKQAVRDVSVALEVGEVVGILGPNGSGKTTSFYMIAGLIRQDAGSIELNGESIEHLPIHVRAKKGIGYLPQEASIFRELSSADNIRAIIELRKELNKQQKADLLESLLEEFDLHRVRDTLGMSLSGGERKRVEIARLLAIHPKFLLFDEPFAGVDPVSVEAVQGVIARLKEKQFGVLITDHNVRETLSICDRVYVLFNGIIICAGTPDEVRADDLVRKHYLGSNF